MYRRQSERGSIGGGGGREGVSPESRRTLVGGDRVAMLW